MTDYKKEEDNVIDFQFDTISEINLKNSSFYSFNDDLKGSNSIRNLFTFRYDSQII